MGIQLSKHFLTLQAIKAMALEAPTAARAPWAAMACLGLFKVFMQWESQGASLDHLVGGVKVNPGPPPPVPESAPMKIETIITTTNMGVPKPLIQPEPLMRDPKRDRRPKKDGPKVRKSNSFLFFTEKLKTLHCSSTCPESNNKPSPGPHLP